MAKRKARTASPSKRKRQCVAKAKPRVATLMVRVFKHKRHGGFAKGTRGRPKGAKDKRPRSVTGTVKALCEEVMADRPHAVTGAINRGLDSDPAYAHLYVKLMRDSIDGPPDSNVNLKTQFKDDELEKAQKDLARKIDALFKHAVAHAATADTALRDETPTP